MAELSEAGVDRDFYDCYLVDVVAYGIDSAAGYVEGHGAHVLVEGVPGIATLADLEVVFEVVVGVGGCLEEVFPELDVFLK